MTVAEPVVGVRCSASSCSARRCGPATPGWLTLIVAVAVMVVATVALARGEAAERRDRRARAISVVAC